MKKREMKLAVISKLQRLILMLPTGEARNLASDVSLLTNLIFVGKFDETDNLITIFEKPSSENELRHLQIETFSEPHLWYASHIGEIYLIEKEGENWFEVIEQGFPRRIYKTDCNVIKNYESGLPDATRPVNSSNEANEIFTRDLSNPQDIQRVCNTTFEKNRTLDNDNS